MQEQDDEDSFLFLYSSALRQASLNVWGSGEAVTTQENIVFTLVVIFGAFIQAILIGGVANIVRIVGQDSQIFDAKLARVRQLMEYHHISKPLQKKICDCYSSLWQHHRALAPSCYDFMEELTDSLTLESKIELFRDMLMSIPFLQRCVT